jgi:hypothetical protein
MTASTRECRCGCDEPLPAHKQYVPGHAPSKYVRTTPILSRPNCACGCGEKTANYARTWISGHRPVGRDAAEFWSRTKPVGDCLEWTGGTSDCGYGVVSWEGQTWGAHRLAWTLTFGPIPDGVWVLHHCDNPPCVNASGGCLYLGDHDQNVADKVERGRQVDGERHGRAKLSAAEVEEIRDRYIWPSYEGAHDSNARPLAEEFGVDRTIIQRLMKNQLWRRP